MFWRKASTVRTISSGRLYVIIAIVTGGQLIVVLGIEFGAPTLAFGYAFFYAIYLGFSQFRLLDLRCDEWLRHLLRHTIPIIPADSGDNHNPTITGWLNFYSEVSRADKNNGLIVFHFCNTPHCAP